MVDFPTSKLDKAFARRGLSSPTKPLWRELMERHDIVPSKAVQAPDVISGFSGSWAAVYGLNEGHFDEDKAISPAPVQTIINRLGQPGMVEINFRPYDWGTIRKGKYGPSLLGHPISFSVIGPSVRSADATFQWILDPSGGQDRIRIDAGATALSTAGTPVAPPVNTLPDTHGISSIPDAGLYLVVSVTGAAGDLDDGAGGTAAGGLGDGQFGEDAAPPGGLARLPIKALDQTSKFEIFRVTAIDTTDNPNDTLVLDGDKRISTHFTVPNPAANTPVIRALMLLTPAATRVVAVPGSGNQSGAEQTFAFVPPATALNSDLMPVSANWDTNGTFDPWTNYLNTVTGNTGEAGAYTQAGILPIPTPIAKGRCRLQGINGEAVVAQPTGRMRVRVPASSPFDTGGTGRVLHLLNVERFRDGSMANAVSEGGNHIGTPEHERLLGYWQIVAAGNDASGNFYDLRMVAQVDPDTGVPFFGNGELLKMETGSVGGAEVWFDFTLHDPISALWTSKFLHPAILDSARLDNIIDPRWAKPSVKGRDVNTAVGHQGRPDRAIFDTSSSGIGNANPGSLLDLGFRAVFFPAKDGGATLVPDFDNPIDAHEVVLDPTKTDENQFIEVDYAAGLIHLSHPPVPGAGCTLMPDAALLNHANNPRGEVVFFAACVPFSREAGQTGVNLRVTGGRTQRRTGDFCNPTEIDQADIYGSRLFWPVASGQNIVSGIGEEIRLSVQLTPLDLPTTGFVDVITGDTTPVGTKSLTNTNLTQLPRVGTFGYTSVIYSDAGNGNNTTLRGVFGGGLAGATITPSPTARFSAVLRRDVRMPNTQDGRTGTDFQFDTTYGFAKRTRALRFNNASLQHEADGSVTVTPEDPRTGAHASLFSEVFSSWVLSGGEMTSVGLGPGFGNLLDFSELTVLIAGVRTVMRDRRLAVGLNLGPPTDTLVYIDGSDPSCPVYAIGTALPLPGTNDILVGQYTHDGVDVLTYHDLRQPLVDVDKRLDITVGAYLGHAQPGDAHFSELADAIEYIDRVGHQWPGQWRRIKVIGPTEEDNAKLPISNVISGLVIEGAARRSDGTVGDLQEVTWKGAAQSLFRMDAVSDWVIRDLNFRYDEDGAGASAVITERNLFHISQASVRNLVVENVRLIGPAHAFLYAEDGAAGSGLDRVIFRNCVAEDLTDHAIRVEAGVDVLTEVHLHHCRFVARKAAGGPSLGLTNYGVIHLGATAPIPRGLSIRDTFVEGGDVGIFMGGLGPRVIDACVIRDTDNAGIVVDCDDLTIQHCLLDTVHTAVGAAGINGVKVGIHQVAGAVTTRVLYNTISLSGGASGDAAIFFQTGEAQDCTVQGNLTDWDISCGRENRVVQNFITQGSLSTGDGCWVETNRLSGLTTGDLTVGQTCVVNGNRVAGDLAAATGGLQSANNWYQGDGPHAVGNSTRSTNDIFGDPTVGSPLGRVTLGDDGVFTGCHFSDGFDGGAGVSRVRMTGCTVAFNSADISVLGTDFTMVGCLVQEDVLPLKFQIDGVDNIYEGNTFEVTTVNLFGNGNVVQGNIITGGAGGLSVRGTFPVVLGNTVDAGSLVVLAAGSSGPRVESNRVTDGAIDLNGVAGCLVIGNTVAGATPSGTISDPGTNSIVQGNTCQESISATTLATDLTFTGNRVSGALQVTNAGSSGAVIDGNRVVGNVEFAGDDIVVQGNRVGGDINFAGDDIVVQGNRVGGDINGAGADRATVVGNRVGGDISMIGAVDPTIVANRVTGDIYVDQTGYIMVANRTTNVDTSAALAGADPDANGIFLGNRMSDNVADDHYYGGAMPDPTATGKDHNEPV